MKKIILLIIASCTVAMATAQKKEHFTFATSVGTGIDMSEPAATPFSLQVLGYYAINKRFSVGVGLNLISKLPCGVAPDMPSVNGSFFVGK